MLKGLGKIGNIWKMNYYFFTKKKKGSSLLARVGATVFGDVRLLLVEGFNLHKV